MVSRFSHVTSPCYRDTRFIVGPLRFAKGVRTSLSCEREGVCDSFQWLIGQIQVYILEISFSGLWTAEASTNVSWVNPRMSDFATGRSMQPFLVSLCT